MAAWGAGVLAMSLEAGLWAAFLIVAVLVLRPRAAWRARLLALGLLQFLIPPLVALPLPRVALLVELGEKTALADTGAVLAVAAWAQGLGLAVGGALLLRSLWTLRRVVRRAETCGPGPIHDLLSRVARAQGIAAPRLLLTDGLGPGAVGVIRPAILLPRNLARELDSEALRMILAHEVAHIARRDPLMVVVRRVTLALWWFHPVAWVLVRLHRAAAEDVCDDVAGRDDVRGYCAALLAAAGGGRVAAAAGLGGHPLRRRFRRLRDRPGGSGFHAWLEARLGSRIAARVPVAIAVIALAAAPLGIPLPEIAGETGSADPTVIRHEVVIRHVTD